MILLTGGSVNGWGDIYLYFGCRKETVDHIYQDELETAKKEGIIKEVYLALSREPDKPKVAQSNQSYFWHCQKRIDDLQKKNRFKNIFFSTITGDLGLCGSDKTSQCPSLWCQFYFLVFWDHGFYCRTFKPLEGH